MSRPLSTGHPWSIVTTRAGAHTQPVHPVLRHLADRRHGVFTVAEAHRAGYGAPEIRSLHACGRWVRLRRGVYVPVERLAAIEGRGQRHVVDCIAALLALDRPTTALSHSSAAWLRGLPVSRATLEQVRLTDPHRWRSGPGYSLVRAPLPERQVIERGPLRLTTPARTLVDCAREWPLEDAVIAMDAALLRGLTTPAELLAAAEAAQHWPGAPRAARAVALADGRAESPLETRGRLRLIGAGLPPDDLQMEIRVGGRLVAVADAWYEDAAVAIEFDGRIKYTDPWRGRSPERVLWEEKQREDEVRALDIGVVRITDSSLGPTWHEIDRRLRYLLGRPGPAVRRFTVLPRVRGLVRTG
jgi:hypothetical protein